MTATGWRTSPCWKTYVGRPEADRFRRSAITQLGNGLNETYRYEDALSVQEAELSLERRLGAPEESILLVKGNLANTYARLGRNDEALSTYREAYGGCKSLYGNCDIRTLMAANNLTFQLLKQGKHAEAVSTLREPLSDSRRALGDDHEMTLGLKSLLADCMMNTKTNPTVDDVREAIAIRDDVCKRSRRLLGRSHPSTQIRQRALDAARLHLARRLPEEG